MFEIVCWNQQRATTTEQGKLKLLACFTTENLLLSLKVWRETQRVKISLSFPNFLTARNKQPHNSLSSCCCSLFVTVSVCRLLDASFSHSKSLSQNKNIQFPLFRPRSTFLSFNKEDLLNSFHKVSQDESLVKGLKQFERIFSLWKYKVTSLR